MAVGPFVVSVSELRRRLAALIEEVARGDHPLFVTQYGFVSAVLVSEKQYRRTMADTGGTQSSRGSPWGPQARPEETPGYAGPPRRVRPGTVLPERRVWTQYGWCDFDVAQILAEQGVETELEWTDEGWMTDDEG